MSQKPANLAVPERFRPSPAVIITDKLMTYAIQAGGMMVIVAVFGIFVFIGSQIWPLFKGAAVEEMTSRDVPAGEYLALGIDEWGELPFLITTDNKVIFVPESGEPVQRALGLPEGTEVTSIQYLPKFNTIVAGTADGNFALIEVAYRKDFENDGKVIASLEPGPLFSFGEEGYLVDRIALGDSGDTKLAVGLLAPAEGNPDGRLVKAAILKQGGGLLGGSKPELATVIDLTDQINDEPTELLVDQQAEGIIVTTVGGEVDYFYRQGNSVTKRQAFFPFEDLPNKQIASIDFILGDVSIVLTNPDGVNRGFSLFVPEGGSERLYAQTKNFPDLPGGASFFSKSLRNKTFLIGSGSTASLRYLTSESVRWEKDLGFPIELGVISGKNAKIALLSADHKLHFYSMDDPHPEASWNAFFGKVWYEGAAEPKYEWQSTGGSDDFEPKLSMVPLLVGTLKGTLYAMVFSLPIALLAAIYTAQFLNPKIKRIVKPTMEIMASLPSVVLGFLAALWLAPLIETKVPSVLLVIIALFLSAFLFGWFWSSLPIRFRRHIKPGWEFLAYMPVMMVSCYAAWNLGPWLESWAFVVTLSDGTQLADFRRWWPQVTGTPFEQRNSLVVGFMMGFAVIPIIFTIAEDSLSNVPPTLTSGSLAVGASRWQTAMMIVLPTASPGIFSAIMIGLGRAVGETMIVVMATGNTPIMDLNIFSGMRTLSANIAVELPEAPHHSTLFRALFLGAMLLFLMTFLVNTVAEVMRQHLREKYKTV